MDTARHESDLLKKHRGKICDRSVVFQTTDDAKAFKADYDRLSDEEINIDVTEVELALDSVGNVLITPADIGRLQGFVQFV